MRRDCMSRMVVRLRWVLYRIDGFCFSHYSRATHGDRGEVHTVRFLSAVRAKAARCKPPPPGYSSPAEATKKEGVERKGGRTSSSAPSPSASCLLSLTPSITTACTCSYASTRARAVDFAVARYHSARPIIQANMRAPGSFILRIRSGSSLCRPGGAVPSRSFRRARVARLVHKRAEADARLCALDSLLGLHGPRLSWHAEQPETHETE